MQSALCHGRISHRFLAVQARLNNALRGWRHDRHDHCRQGRRLCRVDRSDIRRGAAHPAGGHWHRAVLAYLANSLRLLCRAALPLCPIAHPAQQKRLHAINPVLPLAHVRFCSVYAALGMLSKSVQITTEKKYRMRTPSYFVCLRHKRLFNFARAEFSRNDWAREPRMVQKATDCWIAVWINVFFVISKGISSKICDDGANFLCFDSGDVKGWVALGFSAAVGFGIAALLIPMYKKIQTWVQREFDEKAEKDAAPKPPPEIETKPDGNKVLRQPVTYQLLSRSRKHLSLHEFLNFASHDEVSLHGYCYAALTCCVDAPGHS
eukprot:2536213-Pleurochrysis_carterae.AAC.4